MSPSKTFEGRHLTGCAVCKLCQINLSAILAGALRKLADMYPELTVVLAEHLSYSEFAQLLRRSKIFVSPLGCACRG